MRYGSVCSGIEAATVAWHQLDWEPAFFSEIEPFPRGVLKHHYPNVPLHGDFTTIEGAEYGAIDLLVGGTPCQSFSVAGLRGGLDDERGNLALEFLRLAQRTRPRWVVWENVPGVLSSNGGRDFGSILGGLVELGYGFAYRVLDAQFFGVAQRRRRVFVVGCLGSPASAAAVLFERHCLQGHPSPRQKAGQRVADTLTVGANQCSGRPGDIVEDSIARCLTARGAGGQNLDPETANLIAGTMIAMSGKSGGWSNSADHAAGNYMIPISTSSVRRLTPIECERLQGFPDNYTAIPWRAKSTKDCPDNPRYKALGNSMAVPVMKWIGKRIAQVEGILLK